MGLAIGPTLGSLVYEEVDYLYTFVIFGVLLVLGGILIFFMLPDRLNKGYQQQQLIVLRQDTARTLSHETNRIVKVENSLEQEKGRR